MSAFFGEIIEPSSRAFWDDYEQLEDLEVIKPKWKWFIDEQEYEENNGKNIKTFLILEGTRITDFINGIILKGKSPLCQLENSKLSLYEYPEQNLMICLCEEKELNSFGLITELLLPWISKAENVFGMSFQAITLYKGIPSEKIINGCFIRSINSKLNNVIDLERPNFITGLLASVATWRKFKNLSYSCYIIFMDGLYFDMISTVPIIKLFNALDIKCEQKYSPKIINDSNLYI